MRLQLQWTARRVAYVRSCPARLHRLSDGLTRFLSSSWCLCCSVSTVSEARPEFAGRVLYDLFRRIVGLCSVLPVDRPLQTRLSLPLRQTAARRAMARRARQL